MNRILQVCGNSHNIMKIRYNSTQREEELLKEIIKLNEKYTKNLDSNTKFVESMHKYLKGMVFGSVIGYGIAGLYIMFK